MSEIETYQCKSPVLFLVFNRPDVTARVFEIIRQAKPPRLYNAADGPRPGRAGEAEKCEEVRGIANGADWDCEFKKLFQNMNLNIKKAVTKAIEPIYQVLNNCTLRLAYKIQRHLQILLTQLVKLYLYVLK